MEPLLTPHGTLTYTTRNPYLHRTEPQRSVAHLLVGGKVKVKFNVEQAVRPIGGVEVQLYSFFNLGARWEWAVNVTPRPLYSRETNPVPIVQEAGWTQNRSGRVRKISPKTGIRFPDRPARSESLYRLSYPGPPW
jgi:hypothetical protein